ncbi:MAG TPA: helix-turn-helix domain-containing protein [Syntrophomonadaceae bacterium]|nr:helix-turn-helix domain-containing protein [Syntrophomonadaceae bacterium]
MAGFGDALREEREKQGLTLEQVEEATKIRKIYINALEQEEFDILPPRVYASGFVKRYATFLSLDPEPFVEEFKRLAYSDADEDKEEEVLVQREKEVRNRMTERFPVRNVVIAVLFLVIVIWAGNQLVAYLADQGTEPVPEEPAPITQPVEEDKSPVEEEEEEEEETPAPAEGLEMDIRTLQDQECWLEVIVDGKQEYSGLMARGEKKSFKAEKSIFIKAGNAGGINITMNGKKLPPLGEVGQVEEKEYTVENIGDN